MADTATNGFDSLPKEWRLVRLGDVSTLSSGGTPSKKREDFWSGTIPWASPKDMKTPWLHDTQDHISEEGLNDGSRLAPAGSLFVVVRGMILAKDLPVSMAMVPMAFNQDMKAILTSEKIDGEYLLHAFSAFKSHLVKEIGTSSHGTRRIGTQAIQEFLIPLPPLAEQETIAVVLRTVQSAKEATEKVITTTKLLKQSLMRHLFTYGPIPFQQADHVDLQETIFGEAPQHWATELLDDCCTVQTGAAKGRRFGDDETVELPYLRVANVQGGYLDLREMKTITIRKREIDRYSLQNGDVVLTEGGDFDKLGRGFIWRNEIPVCLHQNHVFAVRAERNKLLPEFVAHQTQSEYGRAYFLSVAHRTTNLACINTTKLKAFPMLIPPLSEQREIETNLDAVDRKLAQEEQKRSALSSLFDSLLNGLMTGRIRTTGHKVLGES